MQRLEAILFLAKQPLTSRKLAQLANLADGTEARTLVRSLNKLYDAANRAFRVEELAGGYQLLTRGKFADWVRRVVGSDDPTRLSTPAMETLAIIAYRQPVLRADVEAIRGVNCGEIIRQLMDRDLVQIKGRSEELGRPFLYATSPAFLRFFGFRSLEDLPRKDEFRRFEAETDTSAASQVDDQKETSVTITLAPQSPAIDNNDLVAGGATTAPWTPDQPSAQAPPIEDEEDELYEDDDGLDDEIPDEDTDEDDDEDDFDDDWDDDDDDDIDDEEDADESDDEESDWEEVEDDDWEDEEEDDFDDDDDEEDDWGDDEEE
ncbi:SMC-Scp complex subunit ScpB [Bremerella alba]|uniref:Segregation and condensation protein B n=1 Tax=Bremerella alba TaxID=980252 RepID=A0A7V8V7E3_9BACT|nr:SMC-Scp complex subunit ScpB [Bremerella alba]MBA2116337.1 Segregation and condensation protein B [Bremerella alba]